MSQYTSRAVISQMVICGDLPLGL